MAEDNKKEEGKKKEEGDKKEEKGKDEIKEAIKKNIDIKFYKEADQIGRKKMDAEDKRQHELVRRWEILLKEIEITTKEKLISPFIQGMIGGTYQKEYCLTDQKKIISEKGERGICFRTNVIFNLKKDESKMFKTFVNTEMRASYSDIMSQYIHLELWNSSLFCLNTYISYQAIPLIDIISGSMVQEVTFTAPGESEENSTPFATIKFSLIFQEIWDFYITFKDWTATNVVDGTKYHNYKSKLNDFKEKLKGGEITDERYEKEKDTLEQDTAATSQIKLTHEANNSSKSILSGLSPPTIGKAVWGTIKGGIHFRGTFTDLEQTKLTINLYDYSIRPNLRGSKTVTLEGSTLSNFVKTDMSLINLPSRELLNLERQCQIQGVINFGSYPYYRQTGKGDELHYNDVYLVIEIVQLEGMNELMAFGSNWYITVECKGESKKSRELLNRGAYIFNQKFYFLLPVSSKIKERYKKDSKKYEDEYSRAIHQNLRPMSIIMINLWSKSGGITDHIGNCQFNISEIIGGKYDDIRSPFKNDATKYYSIKYIDCNKTLMSAKSQNSKVKLKFRGYFLPTLPSGVSLGDFPDGIYDMPDLFKKQYSKYYEKWQKSANILRGKTDKERCYTFEAKDQFNRPFFKPRFLSAITSPDMSNVGYRMDRKIRSLKEIFYYVSCFQYTFESLEDVWCSPDFFMQICRGSNEDHVIMLACMFLGCKIENSLDIAMQESKDANKDNQNARLSAMYSSFTSNLALAAEEGKPLLDKYNKAANKDVPKKEKDKDTRNDNLMVGRVFVCQGLTKKSKQQAMWIMTLDKEFNVITFWTVYPTKGKYEFRGRISDKDMLKKFLKTSINEKSKEDTPPKNKNIENNKENSQSQSRDHISLDFDLLNNIEKVDENIKEPKKEEIKSSEVVNSANPIEDIKEDEEFNLNEIYAFKENDKEVIDEGIDQFPFETIDIIFNERNIYLNRQCQNPLRISYNIYKRKDWQPFIEIQDSEDFPLIPPFYNQRSFELPLKDQLIYKCSLTITKDIKNAIKGLRMSENKKTKWKMLDSELKSGFEDILDNLEHCSCGRTDDKYIDSIEPSKPEKEDRYKPIVLIKLNMPASYQFTFKTITTSTLDSERIMKIISHSAEIKEFLKYDSPMLKYVIFGKIYAYPNQVVSVRYLIGRFQKTDTQIMTPSKSRPNNINQDARNRRSLFSVSS